MQSDMFRSKSDNHWALLKNLRFILACLVAIHGSTICSLSAQQVEGDMPPATDPLHGDAVPDDMPAAPAAGLNSDLDAAPKSDASKKEDVNAEGNAAATPPQLIQLGDYRTEELILGLKLTTSSGFCNDVFATIPMPMEYPEQKVRVISTNFPAAAKYYVRPLTDTVQQLVITLPSVAPNTTLEATVRIEVQKAKILGPTDPEALIIPKKLARNLNPFMGPSPLIETNDAKIRKIAREIASTNPPNAWAHVEKIYDYVREAISYREGKAKSVLDALRDKEGDCEEMSGAFVAICRASKIPARCVWVHGHAYPEFYLEDKDGNGCWFPCQVAGTRQFGSMDEIRPILQKGDRFKVPEKTQPQRYVAEYLKVKSVVGGDGPDVEWIRNVK